MNTIENNKLIAEFMGYKNPSNASDIWYHYDTSWDWLMPVVEKIEALGYTFEKNYQPIDRDWQCLIVKGNDILHQEFNRKSLNAAHYVVVEFIKWYNEQDRFICGVCGDHVNEYTYNEDKDVDECNNCK
jgi:hypothetical protein